MPLVGVVIPAYNAERTIGRTIASVRAQTHAELDIVVVDDGSKDRTAELVARHVREDARIRLVDQPNGGVAAARNRGIAECRSDLVAPIDSDDLWHPDKIARQLAELEADPSVGMVATGYSVIDEQDRVIARRAGALPVTNQFEDLCRRNFIGNGSSALMRRQLVECFGGYDSSLRERGAEGCEDLQLYLQIAEVSRLALVRDPLTAYRRGSANMSCNARQMMRSFDLVAGRFCERRPELRASFNDHRIYMLCWLLKGAVLGGARGDAGELVSQLLRTRSRALPKALLDAAVRMTSGTASRWMVEGGKRAPLAWP
ncbi:glycosyltransferase family A protein [Sphingomonas sp. LHG3406-1]|uniref:glycosyltransferase family 2 protein n=1 Tax=Sphingomonas sp. LHG3406-1 TaxID=2804617 RepID=UPI0026148EBA|nr:glycosyltransferase family A protein [Sphingomonas sp. LHG3406-1]